MCVCVASNFVTRPVSIPIVPWDGCSSEKGQEEGAHFTAARATLNSTAALRHTQVEVPESTSVLNHQTLGPGDVKFTFPVYLACLWHSTTRLRSPFQQDAKLQQTWEKALWLFQSDDSDHHAPSLTGVKNLRQQSDAGPLRWSEADDNSVLSRPTVTFSSDWTEQNFASNYPLHGCNCWS